DTRKFLTDMAGRLNLSGRGLSRVLKVARTIADLADEKNILTQHVAEALTYRQGITAF
ncbi:MAG: ATP-dependent protease, partial [Synergistaceae bacterium]|nr:ATP-dependent protease [Synergistaceae bacterium]